MADHKDCKCARCDPERAMKRLVERRDHLLTSLAGYAARFCLQTDLTIEQRMGIVAAVGEATKILSKATKAAYPDFPKAADDFDRAADCPLHEDARDIAAEKGQVS